MFPFLTIVKVECVINFNVCKVVCIVLFISRKFGKAGVLLLASLETNLYYMTRNEPLIIREVKKIILGGFNDVSFEIF